MSQVDSQLCASENASCGSPRAGACSGPARARPPWSCVLLTTRFFSARDDSGSSAEGGAGLWPATPASLSASNPMAARMPPWPAESPRHAGRSVLLRLAALWFGWHRTTAGDLFFHLPEDARPEGRSPARCNPLCTIQRDTSPGQRCSTSAASQSRYLSANAILVRFNFSNRRYDAHFRLGTRQPSP